MERMQVMPREQLTRHRLMDTVRRGVVDFMRNVGDVLDWWVSRRHEMHKLQDYECGRRRRRRTVVS